MASDESVRISSGSTLDKAPLTLDKTNINIIVTSNAASMADTVGSKIIRAIGIILAIFLCFDCQFLPSHACYEMYEA